MSSPQILFTLVLIPKSKDRWAGGSRGPSHPLSPSDLTVSSVETRGCASLRTLERNLPEGHHSL